MRRTLIVKCEPLPRSAPALAPREKQSFPLEGPVLHRFCTDLPGQARRKVEHTSRYRRAGALVENRVFHFSGGVPWPGRGENTRRHFSAENINYSL